MPKELRTKISAGLERRMAPETKEARAEWVGPPFGYGVRKSLRKNRDRMRHPIPDLYVGDIEDAQEVLSRPKGSHIKSILSVTPTKLPMVRNMPRLIIPVDDDGYRIDPKLIDLAVAFIRKAPKPVLVHCDAGANRSTLMATAYVWTESWKSLAYDGGPGMSIDEAIKLCQHRSWNPPAPDIVDLLKRWAGEDKPTMSGAEL